MTTLILIALFCGGCYMAKKAMAKAASNPDLTGGATKLLWKIMRK